MMDIRSLEAGGIDKAFGGAHALVDVSFQCNSGEVHALLGENGAGKSTLVKILTGALAQDAGSIAVDGERQHWRSPADAKLAGVGVVYQDFQLFPHLTVSENVCAGMKPPRGRFGFSSRKFMRKNASEVLERFGINIDPRRNVSSLDAAERKLTEIARALIRSPKFLFLDEPTAALEPAETERLLEIIRGLSERGTGVIFVTHRLAEVQAVADRATALRDGALAGTLDSSEFTKESLTRLVVGRAVSQHLGPQHQPGETIMRLQSAPQRTDALPLDIHVRQGELVAVTGLVGSGVSKLMRTVGGVEATGKNDRLWLDGQEVSFAGPRQAQAAGIGFVSQDRKGESIIPLRSAAENIALPSLSVFGRFGFTLRRKMVSAADECQKLFNIKWTSSQQPISSLSGGNQQKAVLGRWIVQGSRFLVIQEPSQGVDIGARQQIHDHLVAFAEAGGSILFSSSDLDEVRDIAHRIYVMHAGEVVAEFENDRTRQVSREELTQAMANLLSAVQVKGQRDD